MSGLLVALTLTAALDGGMQGKLDPEVIRKEIRAHHEQTWSCYEKNLSPDSVTDFRVVLTFVVLGSGQVDSVTAKSSTATPDVEACLVNEAKSWRFPKPKGGAVPVRYPIIFKADED